MFVPSITHPVGDFIRDWVPKLSAYLPEQLQSQTLDSIAAFLINALLCVIAVCAVNIGSAPILIYMERKVCAHVQCRLGPMRLGWHGTLQTIADVIKMLFKEVYSPSGADKLMFYVAPLIVLIAPFIIAALIPFDHNLIVADIDMGIPMIIALRSGAQMISYEISFAMILLFVVMISGSTSLMDIAQAQDGTVLDWFIFKIPVLGFIAFILFFISSTAEMNRAPFDIAEAEQELTGGYHTEYNGTPFAMFYLAEYIALVTNSALAATCFLGGFHAPCIGVAAIDGYLQMVPGVVWLFAKIYFMIWCYMMVRWTFVRPRVDQLMDFEWKFLLPVNLVLLAAGAVWMIFVG